MLSKLFRLLTPTGAREERDQRTEEHRVSPQAAKAILEQHLALHEEIQGHYRRRERDPWALSETVEVCKKQIDLAPRAAAAFRIEYPDDPLPFHAGFRQLTIIREKQGDFKGALELARQAQQQGWSDNYDSRIERLQKKLSAVRS